MVESWCGSVGCGRKVTVLHHDSDRLVRTGLTYMYSGERDDTMYMYIAKEMRCDYIDE